MPRNVPNKRYYYLNFCLKMFQINMKILYTNKRLILFLLLKLMGFKCFRNNNKAYSHNKTNLCRKYLVNDFIFVKVQINFKKKLN